MPEFELGVPYSEVENSDLFEPMPAGTYEFQVLESTFGDTAAGRPMFKWVLGIINNEEYKGRQLFYNTPMPWNNPNTGQKDISGIGLLVALMKSLRQTWEGGTFTSETYVGLSGKVEVKQKQKMELGPVGKYVPTDEIVNDVKKFVY